MINYAFFTSLLTSLCYCNYYTLFIWKDTYVASELYTTTLLIIEMNTVSLIPKGNSDYAEEIVLIKMLMSTYNIKLFYWHQIYFFK